MQPIINIKQVKNVITKTGLPVGQYAANTYVGWEQSLIGSTLVMGTTSFV